MRTNAQAIEVINEILLEELNEIRQNISFMKKELPDIDVSGDSAEIIKLKQFIEDSLIRFDNKIYWEIDPELKLILSKIEDDKTIENHVIQKKITATVLRMKSEFLVMDSIVRKLMNDYPDDSISDYCKLMRTLVMESLTNMHNCNHAIFNEIDRLN
jgi:hypothetical protein